MRVRGARPELREASFSVARPTSRIRYGASWYRSRGAADRRQLQMTAYLSACTLYKDHAEYLREWIEFHRLVGVERFFLYDNESTDDHEEVLAPYVERGIVEVQPWPTPPSVERGVPWSIIGAFNDCVR